MTARSQKKRVLRVWNAVDRLGYIPNRAAQALRTQKTHTIATIIYDITNPFHPAFVRGVQNVIQSHNFDMVMYNTDGLWNNERKALASVEQGRADGVVGIFYQDDMEMYLPLLERNIPIVRLRARAAEAMEYPLDSLYVDNVEAARCATAYLIERGHRRIGLICGDGPPVKDRMLGYRKALEENGLRFDKSLISGNEFTVEEGLRVARSFLEQKSQVTAIFATGDLLAIGAVKAIQQSGLRAPDDIAIIGFDDILASSWITPSLTTMSVPQELIGQMAAEMLFERLNGNINGGSRSVEIPVELVVRESA